VAVIQAIIDWIEDNQKTSFQHRSSSGSTVPLELGNLRLCRKSQSYATNRDVWWPVSSKESGIWKHRRRSPAVWSKFGLDGLMAHHGGESAQNPVSVGLDWCLTATADSF